MRSINGSSTEQLVSIARRVMQEHGLLTDFSTAAAAELGALNGPATDSGKDVRDLRGLLWCSIDNDDSRDLDQLSVAEQQSGESVRIMIAVADVDATVTIGSAIDTHARSNTTSVYTAAKTFPMLPERLSTDLTSLGPDVDRLAIVVDMTVDGNGTVAKSDVYRALVRNRAKLAYQSVGAWLASGTAPPTPIAAVTGMAEQLRIQDRVAQRLRDVRHQHGALALETTEARAVFQNGLLTDLRVEDSNRAKELIEDFMIAANGVTARFLEDRGLPSIRRVLKAPERWPRIVELAHGFGQKLPATPDPIALNEFLCQRRNSDPGSFSDLSLSIIKLLGSGEYQVQYPGRPPPGHFGLAVRDYTHSTAPNRRFPDLITQRLVKAALAGHQSSYDNGALEALAAHCTEQEDNASKVERHVQKSAAALLLASRVGQEFAGIITGAADAGTWVRISNPVAEGRVVSGFANLRVGDHVRVRLVHIDVEKGFIDFVGLG